VEVHVEFRLLGPLQVLVEGAPVPLRGAAERALLARLALEAGRVEWQACSHRRQASAQTLQCSCMSAWLWHSSPQLLHAWAHACSTARVRLAS
jgi:hypothetical protein